MTSQLIILGNGFDVHCGLNSSYRDFFRNTILNTGVEPFGRKQLQAGASGFWEELLLEYYKAYDKDDYKWCDIESIIKETICYVVLGKIDQTKVSIINGLWKCALDSAILRIPPSTDKIKELGDPINTYLFNYCVDFFVRSTNQDEKFSYNNALIFLINKLLQDLHNLEKRFCKYLKNQIVNPNNEAEQNEEYIIKAVNLLANLTGFAYYKFNKIDDFITVKSKKYLINVFDNLSDVFILNFNYTALFDILEVESPCYYNNVHGKLCSNICVNGCDKSNIIFGVDDNLIQSQGAGSELRLFSKTYRKMLSSDKYVTALPPNDGKAIAIKFYGHSLSEADYSYFQSIFDYYDLYKNSNVSLTFYYSKGFENYDAVYRLISEYGKSLTNQEQGKNLIHKLLLENRLHIQEVKE